MRARECVGAEKTVKGVNHEQNKKNQNISAGKARIFPKICCKEAWIHHYIPEPNQYSKQYSSAGQVMAVLLLSAADNSWLVSQTRNGALNYQIYWAKEVMQKDLSDRKNLYRPEITPDRNCINVTNKMVE